MCVLPHRNLNLILIIPVQAISNSIFTIAILSMKSLATLIEEIE
jgi:hypothetical protein